MANERIFDSVGPESETANSKIKYRVVLRDGTEMTGQSNPDQFSLTFAAQVRYDDVWKWVRDMLGTSKVSGAALARTLPEKCPYPIQDPADAAKKLPLVCVDVQWVRAFGNGFSVDTTAAEYKPEFKAPQPHSQWNNYPYPAWVELNFTMAAVPYRVLDDSAAAGDESKRFVFTKTRYAAENERIPGNSFKFVDGKATPLHETYFRRSSTTQVDCFLVNVPAIPDANIEAVSGGVNKGTFTLGTRVYGAETVMFDTYDKEQMFDGWANAQGERWKYVFKFLCREDGRKWNTFWHPSSGAAVAVTTTGLAGGTPPFKLVDLPAALFKWS